MDPKRFQNSNAGSLLKIRQGEQVSWAFVPKPLPPPLDLDFELISALSAADRRLGELSGLGRVIPNPQLLIGPFIRREAFLSSRIEGTQSDIRDLYAYEARQPSLFDLETPANEVDVREVWNYVRAMEYGLERVTTLPISLRFIRELHGILMSGVRGNEKTPGEFRTRQNWIGRRNSDIAAATYVPPPVSEMLPALDTLEKYLHQDDATPPLIRLAWVHYQFEAIHPFVDGNGRVGRLLISLLLVNWNLLPAPLLYLSAFFERNRDDYLDLLLGVSQDGNWHDWILFFLRGVAEQSLDASSRAKSLQDLQAVWKSELHQANANPTMLRIADLLFKDPIISIGQIHEQLGVSRTYASQAIQRLEQLNILEEVTRRERNRLYRAELILRILE